MKQYSKAIAAFVSSVVAIVAALAADGIINRDIARVVATLVPVLTALGVYVAPANETVQ